MNNLSFGLISLLLITSHQRVIQSWSGPNFGSLNEEAVKDAEKLTRVYWEEFSESKGKGRSNIDWFDIKDERKELEQYKSYTGYQLQEIENPQSVSIKSQTENFPKNSTDSFTNKLTDPAVWVFKKSETINNSFSLTVTAGFKLTSPQMNWWIRIPILGKHASVQMTLDFSGTVTQSISKSATYDYSLEIPVPALTTITENFYIKETN